MASTEMKPLTEKQQRVYALLAEGRTHSEIASVMGIKSLAGVNSHVAALAKKGYLDDNGAPRVNGGATVTTSGSGSGTKATMRVESSIPAITGDDPPTKPGNDGSLLHPAFALDDEVQGIVAAQGDSLRRAIENIDKALAVHDERQQEIAKEAEAHSVACEGLTAQRKQAEAALAALDGFES